MKNSAALTSPFRSSSQCTTNALKLLLLAVPSLANAVTMKEMLGSAVESSPLRNQFSP